MIKNNLKQLYKLKSWLELEKIWLMRQWRHVEMKWGGELNCSQNRHLATKQASPWEHIKSNFSQNPTVSLEQTTISTASRSPGLRQQAVALHFRQDEQRSARDVCAHRSRETAGACLQARSLVPLSAGKAAFACSLPGCSSASAGRHPPLQCNCPLFPPAALRPRWPSHTHTHTADHFQRCKSNISIILPPQRASLEAETSTGVSKLSRLFQRKVFKV